MPCTTLQSHFGLCYWNSNHLSESHEGHLHHGLINVQQQVCWFNNYWLELARPHKTTLCLILVV